jgi:hypothetical protein
MNPKVFIIILNWNGKKDTLECLDSLRKINYGNYNIILVDNDSKDDSVKEITKNFPKVRIIQNKKNLGWAGGNNIGIKYAIEKKADYILLLNNDTIVDRKFISEMVRLAESDEKIGIVSPKAYFYSNPKILQYTVLRFNFKNGKCILGGYGEKDRGQFDKIEEMDFCGGACMLVKKKVFKKIGLLSEDYFMYFDDNDFGIRTRKAGYKIMFCPKAKIWHKISISTGGQSNPSKEYLLNRNRVIFMKKYPNKFSFYRFLAYLFLESMIPSLIFIKKRRFDLLNSKIKGIFEGIKWKR